MNRSLFVLLLAIAAILSGGFTLNETKTARRV